MAKKKKKQPQGKPRRVSRGAQIQRILFIVIAVFIIASFIISLIA